MAVLSVSSFLVLSLLAISIMFLITRLLRGKSLNKNYAPGPKGIPILLLGSLLSLEFDKRDQVQVIGSWIDRYGPIVSFKLLNQRFHVLADMDLVKEALHDSHYMSDRRTFIAADEISGKKNTGVVFSNGAEWQDLRRFFASVIRKIEDSQFSLEVIIGDACECVIAEIEKAGGESQDPKPLISTSMANIITKIVTGEEYNEGEIKGLVDVTNRIYDLKCNGRLLNTTAFFSKLSLPPVKEIKAKYKQVYDFVKDAIRRRTATFDPEDDDEPTNFIECFLTEKATRTAHGSWTERDDFNYEFTITDTLVAGRETPTTTMMWFLHNMAVHTADQERVRDEIRAVVGGDRRPLQTDHVNLPLTEATIMESLRFTPALDFHLRHLASRDCKVGGYDVSKGDVITTNMWYLAQSPKLWDRPEEFRPSRFLDSSGAVVRHLEAMPFGYGRRACAAEHFARMLLFMFSTYILQDFKLSLPDGAPRSIPAIRVFTNRPSPYKIHFTKIR